MNFKKPGLFLLKKGSEALSEQETNLTPDQNLQGDVFFSGESE